MRLRIVLCATVMICAALQSNTGAQELAKGEAKAAPGMQEMMKKWMEAATPGEGHKYLDQLVGKWDISLRAWMDPSKPPQESKGACDAKWILDGRFVYAEMSSQIMGMPYKGVDIWGYDNYKKRYVVSHVDNMGTAISTGEGKLDLSKQLLTAFGKMDDPTTDERDKPVKYVTRLVNKDKYVFEIYDEVGSPHEFKILELTYTRAKP
jgi:Protein of unknown function (DUF1579)